MHLIGGNNTLKLQMKEFKINNWQDYWKLFDSLISLLKEHNQSEVIAEFKDAQLYVNGMTDGWFEFHKAFKNSIIANKEKLTDEEFEIAEYLIESLNQSLANR